MSFIIEENQQAYNIYIEEERERIRDLFKEVADAYTKQDLIISQVKLIECRDILKAKVEKLRDKLQLEDDDVKLVIPEQLSSSQFKYLNHHLEDEIKRDIELITYFRSPFPKASLNAPPLYLLKCATSEDFSSTIAHLFHIFEEEGLESFIEKIIYEAVGVSFYESKVTLDEDLKKEIVMLCYDYMSMFEKMKDITLWSLGHTSYMIETAQSHSQYAQIDTQMMSSQFTAEETILASHVLNRKYVTYIYKGETLFNYTNYTKEEEEEEERDVKRKKQSTCLRCNKYI
jgi:hypothetical protein